MTYGLQKFKVGDKVKAVPYHQQYFLTAGKVYEVFDTLISGGVQMVLILNDDGREGWYYQYRFELANEEIANLEVQAAPEQVRGEE